MKTMSEKDVFKPYIPAEQVVKEFSLRALLLGLFFGLFFAVANGYLALKIGGTVTASIPAAIMSMAILKAFFKGSTALENNIVQTTATVGEGLAAGVIFTIPALILLGETPSIGRTFLLTATGGILGILFMIPMRRYIIVEEHKKLPFPEGTACAEIIKAGENKHHTAGSALWGVMAAAVYKLCSTAFFFWQEQVSWNFSSLKKATFSIDTTPALLGVGYIIGPKIAGYMLAGGIFAWWTLIPLIVEFGLGSAQIYPSKAPISLMSADEIWSNYVRYIGAGCLAIGGVYNLLKIFPLLFKTLKISAAELFQGFQKRSEISRTQRDISLAWLILGSIGIILFLWLFPTLPMNFLTVFLLVVLSFFFVAVTSITVGLVGSSSNPASGMTITTLLITCIIFVLLGWTERVYLISAMTMGCVANCAICMAGTTSQDLKTGFLLGSTPIYQQVAEIIGVFIPALSLGYVVYILNETYGIGSAVMPAPQATLMSMIVKGVISGTLPYALVGIGVSIGVIMIILNIPVLPFALGVYLPLSISVATMVGALARAYVDKKGSNSEKGTLAASGLIGGDACLGVFLAFGTLAGVIPAEKAALLPAWLSLVLFLLLGIGLAFFSSKKGPSSS